MPDEAPETPSADVQTLDERMMAHIEKEASAAEESAPVEEPIDEAEEAPAEEAKADEASEKVEVTSEQLADSKFWGNLDADGWARMERDYPVETKHVKAAQAAATRIVNEARKTTTEPAKEERSDAKPKVSDEMRAAIRKSQSFDEEEAAEGALEMARIAREEDDRRRSEKRTEAEKRTNEVLTKALALAADPNTGVPKINELSDDELGDAIDADKSLQRRLAIASRIDSEEDQVFMAAEVMKDAGRAALSKRAKVEADKKGEKRAADTERLRRGETSASSLLTSTPGGGKTSTGPKSFETHGLAFIEDQLATQSR